MLKDREGNRLFRKVDIRIIFPEKIFPPKLMTYRAGGKNPGDMHKGFGPGNIDEILDGIVEQLDTLYPFWEFALTELAPEHRTARYVLNFAGYRAQAPIIPTELLDSTVDKVLSPLQSAASSEIKTSGGNNGQ